MAASKNIKLNVMMALDGRSLLEQVAQIEKELKINLSADAGGLTNALSAIQKAQDKFVKSLKLKSDKLSKPAVDTAKGKIKAVKEEIAKKQDPDKKQADEYQAAFKKFIESIKKNANEYTKAMKKQRTDMLKHGNIGGYIGSFFTAALEKAEMKIDQAVAQKMQTITSYKGSIDAN